MRTGRSLSAFISVALAIAELGQVASRAEYALQIPCSNKDTGHNPKNKKFADNFIPSEGFTEALCNRKDLDPNQSKTNGEMLHVCDCTKLDVYNCGKPCPDKGSSKPPTGTTVPPPTGTTVPPPTGTTVPPPSGTPPTETPPPENAPKPEMKEPVTPEPSALETPQPEPAPGAQCKSSRRR